MNEIKTIAERDALPVGSIVIDAYAATCIRARMSDPAMPLDWVRVTTAVKGGEHHHGPFLPANVERVGWSDYQSTPDAPARTEPTEEQVTVQCVWTGEAGYRCPRCGLYVCVPQQAHGAECPRCVVSSFEVLGDQIHDAHEEWDGMVERDPAELTRAILALLRGEA